MLNRYIMIISCPACKTRYAVPDNAIGIEGRTVRCAKCRHSWFQDGPAIGQHAPERSAVQCPPPPAPPPAPPHEPVKEPDDRVAEVQHVEEGGDEPAPPPLPERVYADEFPASAFDRSLTGTQGSSFDHQPPFRPRRNRARMWTIAGVIFALLAFAAIGAVAWLGLPGWMPLSQPTFAEAQPDLVLDFPPNKQDRRILSDGTPYFGASGKITNVGSSRRTVPTILIVLRDARERIVYSSEVVPPKRQLNPGESVTINEAFTDVPRSARFAEIGWKPG